MILLSHFSSFRGAYLGQGKTKEDCAGMKADNNKLKLADFERGCAPLQNQEFKFPASG
jgi:hypothetical protein